MPEAGRGLKGVPLASAVFNHTLNLRVRKCRRMMKKKKNSLITPPVDIDTSGFPYLQCEKYHSHGHHKATVKCGR